MEKDKKNNQDQPKYSIEEVKPDKDQLLEEKIKSEQKYLDVLKNELSVRMRRRWFIKLFPLWNAKNEKAVFKLNVEVMAKMNFIANVHRLKTPKQTTDANKANLQIAK